ncbi:hypothetical protein QYE76_048205 [Lolium multiflorum]|uniref:Ribonuclease H1 N-terminal domain-containing protein n=1 Tax=Lolium multiflorum TaxID=4521 RepID=A0AAD8QHU7_LOLMU|nr:hypothetical protein QYE76_048205 [Lolium multiflorum]
MCDSRLEDGSRTRTKAVRYLQSFMLMTKRRTPFFCLSFPKMTYYVVFEGRVPGVYEEWENCKKQVHKFNGNC